MGAPAAPLRAKARPRLPSWRRPGQPALIRLAAALGLAALALTLAVRIHPAPLPGDIWLTHRIQSRQAFEGVAGLVNTAGNWYWQWPAVALAALLTAARPRAGARARRTALAAFAAAAAIRFWDDLLKVAVQSPRPTTALGVRVDHLRDSYGFPSGHVYSDVLLYGAIAVFATSFAGRRAAAAIRVVALAIILLAGLARVYAGAHWPSDTIGGYLWGAAALCLVVAFGNWAARRHRPRA